MDAGDDCSSEALPGTLNVWICFQAMTKMILENQQELDTESGYYMLIKLMRCGIKKKKSHYGKNEKVRLHWAGRTLAEHPQVRN